MMARLAPAKILIVLAICGFACQLSAQTPSPATKSLQTAIPQMGSQDAGGAFWRIDGNYDSVLHLRNILETDSLRVTPVLWMADGTEYDLAPVTIDKSGVAVIDINEVLRDAPPDVAPHVSEIGSAGVRYNWRWAAVMGQVISTDVIDSMSYASSVSTVLDPARAQKDSSQQNRFEGMWWLRDAGVEPFLSLVNTGSTPLMISIALTGKDDAAPVTSGITLGAKQSQLVMLSDLVRRVATTATEGGIYVSSKGQSGALAVGGGLQNPNEGYSAPITFLPIEARDLKRDISTTATTFAAVGVLVGSPEPRMQFPEATHFEPYATVRNLNSRPTRITLAATYMNQQPITMPLVDMKLSAHETRQLDLKALLSRANLTHYSGEMNFTFKVDGGADELLVSAGSTSADGNYVFNVEPMILVPETGKIFCYWAVSGKTDTMISFWNSGGGAQDAELLLSYQGGHYRLPVHLDVNASLSINIESLIKSGVPDADGNVIPSNVTQGSAQLVNPHHRRDPLDIHAHESVFNVETATCNEPCPICDSVIYVTAIPDGFVTPAGTVQYHTTATSKTNGSYDVTYKTTWGSSNTGVATIVANGSQGGLATGQSAGLATMTGQFSDTGVPPWKNGQLCSYGSQCPVYVGHPTAPIKVQVPHQILVLADESGTQNCTLPSISRVITYSIEDSTGSPLVSPVQIHENVPVVTSTCNNSIPHTGTGCVLNSVYAPNNVNEFNDYIWAGCPSSISVEPCGFTFPNQQWQYCPASGPAMSIGTVGLVKAMNAVITVDGNSVSLDGTTFYP